MTTRSIRKQGRAVEALLILLKHLTAHARWLFAALLLFYALSGVRSVRSNEQALLLRFGKIQPEIHGPGLLIGMPDPFDRLVRFETGREFSIPLNGWATGGVKISDPETALELNDEQLTRAIQKSPNDPDSEAVPEKPAGSTLDPVVDGYTLTADFNIIQGRFVLRYRINDPFLYATAGDDIDTLLSRLAYRALSSQIGTRNIDSSLTADRRELAARAADSTRILAGELNLGVSITAIDIIELAPPSQVVAAFEDVSNARQFAKTIYENSRQYHDETLEKYRGEAAAITYRAEGHAAKLTSTAAGESAAFQEMLVEHRRSPALVSQRLLSETLSTVLGGVQSRTLVPAGQARPSLMIEPAPEFSR
ncbi:protease modulator HflK [Haloferula chungangensis]|uniref:Protease modulator HflK n=1 Tax=Haloferula chungangensis TaxID=1048331 RepID=A0ABW2L5G2_9BACT